MAEDILKSKSSHAIAIQMVKILSVLPLIILSILLASLISIAFLSQSVDADVIRSGSIMAIGTVEASCANDSVIETTGFCSMVFGESRTYSEGALLLKLELFDMSPGYTNCSINCNITRAEIFDTDGNPLVFTIDKSRNGQVRYDSVHDGEYGYAFAILLLLLLLVSGFILLKISRSYRND